MTAFMDRRCPRNDLPTFLDFIIVHPFFVCFFILLYMIFTAYIQCFDSSLVTP